MELIEGTWTDEEIAARCDDRGRICVAEASCQDLGPTVGGVVRDGCPFGGIRFDKTVRCVAGRIREAPV